MKFNLVDRITELLPARRICTVKSLSFAEEYLADHFPAFPVMPGVLMLECMVQSAAWLVRGSQDFAHSLILLADARNVAYKSFLRPGEVLNVQVECKRLEQQHSEMVGRGFCDDRETVKARFTLTHANLADTDPSLEVVDRELIAHARAQFARIGGEALVSLAATS